MAENTNPPQSAKSSRDQVNIDAKVKLSGFMQQSDGQDNHEAFRPSTVQSKSEQPKLGRRPLGVEKRSERVTITFTVEELHQTKEKAGREPLGSYVRRFLDDNDFFKQA